MWQIKVTDGILERRNTEELQSPLTTIAQPFMDSGRSYREELRRTFLHELGHYLGLEEDDLAVRNVD